MHNNGMAHPEKNVHKSVIQRALFCLEQFTRHKMACILKEPRSAWAIAIAECTVFVLPSAMFERVLAQDPAASRRLVSLMACRLSANNELICGAEGR